MKVVYQLALSIYEGAGVAGVSGRRIGLQRRSSLAGFTIPNSHEL